MFPAVHWVNIVAAVATHAWFRINEPQDLLHPFLALLSIPSPMAYFAYISRGWISVAGVYLLFLATLLASIATYRLSSFHPLAGYPGPLLCKLSKIWPAYIASQGKLHHYYKKLHEIYGPIVRIGPNELSMIDKEAVSAVLGAHGMPKGPLWEGRISRTLNARNGGGQYLISERDLRRHAQLRKPWNKAFGNTPMKDYEDIMIQRAAQLSDHLRQVVRTSSDNEGHVNLAKWISFFSFDFMGDMAFGGGFELMRDGDTDGLWAGMEQALLIPSVTQHIPWTAHIIRLGVTPLIGANLRKFGAFAVKQATMRSKANVQKRDLFYYLLDAADPDSTVDPFPLIVSNSALAIVAGSDTTSSVLSNIIYYLLRHPQYLHQLRCEVDTCFPEDGTMVDTAKLVDMKILNAIINETLRLQPAVPSSLQRAPAKGSGGKAIGNNFIAEGTAVNISPYVLHRQAQYFSPRPDDFWPERWLLAENEDEKKRHNIILDQAAFIPFSIGPANCAGKSLALLELRYVTTMLVREFDFAFEVGYLPEVWEKGLEDRFVVKKGALPVVLTCRKG